MAMARLSKPAAMPIGLAKSVFHSRVASAGRSSARRFGPNP